MDDVGNALLPPRSGATSSSFLVSRLLPLALVLIASAVAYAAYAYFLDHPRDLWNRPPHDRNAHYLLGISLAQDLRQGDVLHLLHDIDGARMWGPLYGVLVAVIESAAGTDFRLAVLPSLLGWIGSALLVFLIARRVAPAGGTFAGLFASLFILASPTHHAFATDVMLESLGACLSLLAIYCYLVIVQDSAARGVRWLGLTLTLLFFLKYNYWTLMVFALVVAEFARRRRFYVQIIVAACRHLPWLIWLKKQLRSPSNYVLTGLVALTGYVAFYAQGTLTIAGRQIAVHSSQNLIHAAYIVFFYRVARWWWQSGRGRLRASGEVPYRLACWHAWPVAIWFLMPKRLGYFFYYLSPANGGDPAGSFSQGLFSYTRWFMQEYHVAVWAGVLALALIPFAFLASRRFRPGGAVVLWVLVVAAVLTVSHPNRKARLLCSWVGVTWVVAGIGCAELCLGRWTRRLGRSRPWLAGAGLCSVACVFGPAMLQPQTVTDSGAHLERISDLEVTDSYLSELAHARRTLVLCNHVALKQLAQWTYLERYGNLHGMETDIKGYGKDYVDDAHVFAHWVKSTKCDTVVFIDLPPGSSFYVADAHTDYSEVPHFLAAQSTFLLSRQIPLPRYGCSVSIWRKGG